MKILFISHEATLTGAPLVLLNLIKWIKINKSNVDMSLIHLRNGSRLRDFGREVQNMWVLPNLPDKYSKRYFLIKAILAKFNITLYNKREQSVRRISDSYPDLVYCNTVICIKEGMAIKENVKKCKLIVHVHELPIIIDQSLPDFKQYISHVDGFIAASGLVKEYLISNYGIPSDNIQIVHEFVDEIVETFPEVSENHIFKVGASGYVHWRKGYDIFILIANEFTKAFPQHSIKFEWVGKLDEIHSLIVKSDIEKLGLSDIVSFSGETNDALKKFSDFDLFLMVSREDPFPLVCIEVGLMGKPIICFEKASGTVEMLKEGGGKVVPYLDVNAVVKEIALYFEDKELYNVDSDHIKKEASKYVTRNQAPKIFKYLESVVKK